MLNPAIILGGQTKNLQYRHTRQDIFIEKIRHFTTLFFGLSRRVRYYFDRIDPDMHICNCAYVHKVFCTVKSELLRLILYFLHS